MVTRKYFSIFKFGLKSQWNFRMNYISSIVSLVLHIFIFANLWDYVLKGKLGFGYTKTELIWYIIMAEFIIFCVDSKLYRKIADMVKDGSIANMLIRPVNFVIYIFSEEAASLVKLLVNSVVIIALGWIFAGVITVSFIQMMFVIVAILLSFILQLLLQTIIGLFAFFWEENSSMYLILSKFQFFLVFTPLEFFPSFFQDILKWLPTTYAIYPAGKLLVHFDIALGIKLVILQVVSIAFYILVVSIMYKKGVRKINVNGG